MTATYDAEAAKFGKRVQWLIEIDLPRCAEDYTTGGCTAGDAGDGSRCYNTFATCQDQDNFNLTTTTYRFCLAHVPFPDSSQPVWPYLRSIVPVAQKVDPARLFTFPGSVKMQFEFDWNPPVFNADLSAIANTTKVGEFWRNVKTLIPNHSGVAVRVKRGFFQPRVSGGTDAFTLADFEKIGPDYQLSSIDIQADHATVIAHSPLAEMDKKEVPFAISEDNTIQDTGGINDSDTVINVLDASEFPDPSDYTRNTIYIRVEDEVMRLSAVDTINNRLTVDQRGWLGTTAAAHAEGTVVEHVAFFGTVNATTGAVSSANVMDVIQDLLEFADVDASTVKSASFTEVKNGVYPNDEINRLVSKPRTVAKHIQPFRENRGIIIYIDNDGQFAANVIAPNDSADVLTEDKLADNPIKVTEDDESRITRVTVWYDPDRENPDDDPDDYLKRVRVINSTLEGPNEYGDKREREVFDPWIDPDLAVSKIRNYSRRLITRQARGTRTIEFHLEVADATYNVGDNINIQTRHVLDRDGTQVVIPGIVIERAEAQENLVKYKIIDTTFYGRFMRIGPDTMTATYGSATNSDKIYGYWGNVTSGRQGGKFEPGYRYW